MIFDKNTKHSMAKGNIFNKWWWENWISTCTMINLDPYLTPYIKIKWIKDLDINLLEEKSHDTGSGSNFLDLTPKAPKKKEKLDYIKIKMVILQVIYPFFCLSYSAMDPSSIFFISVSCLVLRGLW